MPVRPSNNVCLSRRHKHQAALAAASLRASTNLDEQALSGMALRPRWLLADLDADASALGA